MRNKNPYFETVPAQVGEGAKNFKSFLQNLSKVWQDEQNSSQMKGLKMSIKPALPGAFYHQLPINAVMNLNI